MRILLLAGASALALATPAFAQQGEDLSDHRSRAKSPIDSLVEDGAAGAAAGGQARPATRCSTASMRWRPASGSSRRAMPSSSSRPSSTRGGCRSVETRAAKAAQFTWAPTIADPTGNFTFKPRGVIEADARRLHRARGRL